MKRKLKLSPRLLIILAVLAPLGTAAIPATANAATPIGGSGCDLHAYLPSHQSGIQWYASGEISCNTSSNLDIQVCMQQLVSGGWQTIGSSCTSGSSMGLVTKDITSESYDVSLTLRRWYRTWDWGSASNAEGHGNVTYQSSGVCIRDNNDDPC